MPLSQIPAGASVFVDANVLAYHFLRVQPFVGVCRAFFDRVAERDLRAFTSADAATDVIHRAMVTEAVTQLGLESREAVSYLKTHPEVVKQLRLYKSVPGDFTRTRVSILEVTYREIHSSKRYREEYGLLARDSVIVAVMERHKLIHLVSNDPDFERVPGIKVWRP